MSNSQFHYLCADCHITPYIESFVDCNDHHMSIRMISISRNQKISFALSQVTR